MNTDNPFYNNYLFTKADMKRATIKKWQYPFLWLLTTYVCLNDGYVFYYKIFGGRIFLMDVKPLPED